MSIPSTTSFDDLFQALRDLIRTPALDAQVRAGPEPFRAIARRLSQASEQAWAEGVRDGDNAVAAARLTSQRALYELNRLRLYWFDDPVLYVNERSPVLAELQNVLEQPWQAWLGRCVPSDELELNEPRSLLSAWVERDLSALDTPDSRWLAERMDLAGYLRLLEIASLNGLVEASQLSRAVGGAAHPVQATLFRILMEEYGAGRMEKKHSTFFARMLEEQGLATQPEGYLASVPWEVLSAINQAFFLAENKRYYLRFCGAFTYTEVSTPVSFRGHAAAARRLGLSDGHHDYWSLHIREDQRHGAWMLEQVALPLLEHFPGQQRELLFGYAQQREVERMAGMATVRACRAASAELSL